MAYLLMVDDNPQTQTYLGRILRHRTRHELVFARSAREGIDRIVERRPDLIFLDLFLPGGTDGFQLFETLRGHPATASIPILIHTAVPLDPLTQIRLRRVHHDGFLEFPVPASELIRVIDAALARHQTGVHRWRPPTA
ncbi:MAG: response regulator [Candidatus Latescibacterota bacterium]